MRTAISILPALAVGFLLLWGMQAMIRIEGRLEEPRQNYSIDFVRLKRDTAVQTKRRVVPKKLQQEEPPIPQIATAKSHPGSSLEDPIPIMASSPDLGDGKELVVSSGGDADIIPLVRVEPLYPPRALKAGVSGWVDVMFTITPAGTVKDARVINHYPSAIFDREALRAVRKWKYAPKVEEGRPVERAGVAVHLVFRLESQQPGA